MRCYKKVLDSLDYLVDNDPGHRGMQWVKDKVQHYLDGMITFGEMMDTIRMDEDNCTDGAKFDALLILGFSLEEAKKLLL